MNGIKIFSERRTYLKRFFIVCLFNLLALSPLIVFSCVHYSADAYGLVADWANTAWYISCFRYFAALVTSFVALFGHNPIFDPTFDIVFYIIIGAIAATVLVRTLYKLIGNPKHPFIVFCIIDFSVLITVANVWFTDILTFAECIAFDAVGLLLCVSAIVLFAKSRSFLHYILSLIIFICSAATFQQFISIFTIYTILILAIKVVQLNESNIKKLFLFYIKPALFILVGCVLYYLIGIGIQRAFNIAPNKRASLSIETIFSNSKYFIKQQHSFLKGRGFFSTEFLTVCYFVAALLFFVCFVIYWKKTKEHGKAVFIGISFIIAYVAAYLPGLVSTSHGTRTICALFSVFALFSIGAIGLHYHRIIAVILMCVVMSVFAVNIYKTVNMATEQIVGNTLEASYADSVVYEIEKYEKENDIKVDTIGFTYDEYPDINGDLLYLHYAIEPLIELRAGREFTFIRPSEDINKKYFTDKDWQYFDADQQIVFDNNVVYICVY